MRVVVTSTYSANPSRLLHMCAKALLSITQQSPALLLVALNATYGVNMLPAVMRVVLALFTVEALNSCSLSALTATLLTKLAVITFLAHVQRCFVLNAARLLLALFSARSILTSLPKLSWVTLMRNDYTMLSFDRWQAVQHRHARILFL